MPSQSIEQRQVSAPESERSPTTNPNSSPREERRFGVVTFVGIDKNNAVFAKVESQVAMNGKRKLSVTVRSRENPDSLYCLFGDE